MAETSGTAGKATVVLSAQLQNEIKKYLARVEAALFPAGASAGDSPAACVLRLDGTTPERSLAAYTAAGDIDKLFIIARVCNTATTLHTPTTPLLFRFVTTRVTCRARRRSGKGRWGCWRRCATTRGTTRSCAARASRATCARRPRA